MKFNLYEKIVKTLYELKEYPGYGSHINRFNAMLIPNEGIHIFDCVPENIIIEVRDKNTIINRVNMIYRSKSFGAAYIWDSILKLFAGELEKKLGSKMRIWNVWTLNLYEKVADALEDLKKDPRYDEIVKDYAIDVGFEDQIFVHNNGTVIFEIKDEKELINHGEYKGFNPEWDAILNTFASNLKEKVGNKVKIKNILFKLKERILQHIIEKSENEVLALAEEIKAEKKVQFKGPWRLEAAVKPYKSREFRLEKAKKLLADTGITPKGNTIIKGV